MDKSVSKRIKRIQQFLGVPADGMVGPATLTAIEKKLFKETGAEASLTVSRKGLEQLVRHEISSPAYYRKFLSHPVFPGGQSGVTIGIGYDLGYCSADQVRKDWGRELSEGDIEKLVVVAGVKGEAAKAVLDGVSHVDVKLDSAERVFYQAILPRYATSSLKAYPGLDALFPDAQAALLSLVYNRGTRMTGDSRKEMKAIQPLVAQQDYSGIADQIIDMKRLWEGRNLDGLLKRRDDEARLVRTADRSYDDAELVHV